MHKINPYKLNLSKKYSTHNLLVGLIGKNKMVLDVGCNDGYLGFSADSSNIFYGIEYFEEMKNKAEGTYKKVWVGDLNKLPQVDENLKFDLIIFADVLEHLVYPEQVLNFYKKYLKKDGRIIVSLPNIANWQIRLKLLFGNFNDTETGIMDKTHLHYYTFEKAEKLANDSGLGVVAKYGGASFFGTVIKIFPFMKELLATNVILLCGQK